MAGVASSHQLRQSLCRAFGGPINFGGAFTIRSGAVKKAKTFSRPVFHGVALFAHAYVEPPVAILVNRRVHGNNTSWQPFMKELFQMFNRLFHITRIEYTFHVIYVKRCR